MNDVPKRSMFAVMIARSIKNRRGRVWVAILAVAVGATLASSLLTIAMGSEGLVARELRGYGANIMVVPKAEIQVGSGELSFGSIAEKKLLDEGSLEEIGNAVPEESLVGYVPYLYVPVNVGSETVVFVGTWLDEIKDVNPWWRVEGGWVDGRDSLTEVMVGRTLAEKMDARVGEGLAISRGSHLERVRIVGMVETGGPEDYQILGTLRLAQSLSGEPGAVHMVGVSVLAHGMSLESIAERIEKRVEGVDAKIIGQVVRGEELVLGKMGLIMILVTALVLTASGLGVMSTMTTTVMERRREIGLLEALGADDKLISLLHLAEASLIGLAGGVFGYVAGSAFAALIGLEVYGEALPPQPTIFPVTILISVGVVLLASIIPVKNALRVETAMVLRGE